MSDTKSKYAKKRQKGKMMYGPCISMPKPPHFKPTYVPPHLYWWGEPRNKREEQK
jgi:hypothetical protein